MTVDKDVKLLGYARVRLSDGRYETAKVLSDSTCWLEDGSVLTAPPEEMAKYMRMLDFAKREDALTEKAVNIMQPVMQNEESYVDAEDKIDYAAIARQKAINEKKRQREIEKRRKILEDQKKKKVPAILIVFILLAIIFVIIFSAYWAGILDPLIRAFGLPIPIKAESALLSGAALSSIVVENSTTEAMTEMSETLSETQKMEETIEDETQKESNSSETVLSNPPEELEAIAGELDGKKWWLVIQGE